MTTTNYYLVATQQRLCLVGSDGGDGQLQLDHSNGRASAIWSLTPVLGGYLIIDQKYGRCVVAASPTALAHADVAPDATNRIWNKVVRSVDASGAETVNLIDQKYGLALFAGENGALSLQDPQTVQSSPGALWTLTPATESTVCLRTYFSQYVQLNPTGNGVLTGTASAPGGTAAFQLIELGGGRVALQASNGMYVSGGNGTTNLVASRSDGIFAMENFFLTDLAGGCIALKAANNKFVSADQNGGGVPVQANRDAIGGWEAFALIKQPTSQICLRVYSGQYVHLDPTDNQTLVAKRSTAGGWEPFLLIDLGGGYVALRASNGKYVSAQNGGGGKLFANRSLGIGPFERFLLSDLGNGTIALQASNGMYVSSDKEAGGVALTADRAQRGAFETFGIVRQPAAFTWETLAPNLANVSSASDGTIASSGKNSFQWNGNEPAGLIPGISNYAVSGGNQSWLVDSTGRIFRFANSAWAQVPSGPTQLSAGVDGTTWGVNNRTIYHWNGSSWSTIGGALDQVSVASASRICGVNDQGNIYSWTGGGWNQIPGTMKSVSIGTDGTLFAIHPQNGVCWRSNGSWEHVPINLKKVAVASSGLVLGTDPNGALLRGTALPGAALTPTSWQTVSGGLAQVAAAADGTVWGVGTSGKIYKWAGRWEEIDGALVQISVGSGNQIWGVNSAGNTFFYRGDGLGWEHVPGPMKQVAIAADSTLWGVNASGQICRWNSGWQVVGGILSQISVGSASLIYGVNSGGAVFRWNGSGWDQLPGLMRSVSVASDGTVHGLDNNGLLHRLQNGVSWVPLAKSLAQVSCASSAVLWGVDNSGAIYRGTVGAEPVADRSTRVQVQEEQSIANPIAYRYSTGSLATATADGFRQLGVAFVAHSVPQPGTVPIYQETQLANPGAQFHFWHRSEAEARSFGWVPTRVAFHAFMYPAAGTVPVYRETVSGTASYHFSINSAAAAAQKGFLQSDIAFYAYPPQELPISLSLPAMGRAYDWTQSFKLPEPGRGAVSFVADATTDIHIAICAQKETSVALYEIVIGSADSGLTVIRRAAGGAALATAATGLPSTGGTNRLWVSVNRTTGQIRIGRGDLGQNQILAYTDPSFLADVQYLAFSTGDAPIKYSGISVAPLAPESLSLSAQNRVYDWARCFTLPAAGSGVISFAAQATGDVQLAISPQRASTGPLYEIVIGTASNGQTVLRRAAGGAAVATAATGVTGSGGSLRLWVSISRETGLVQIGRDTIGLNVILSYQDPAFLADALHCALTSADTAVSYSAISTQGLPPVVFRWKQGMIGSNYSGLPLKRGAQSLPAGFDHPPAVLLLCPRGADYADTFTLSASGVGATYGQVNAYRTDSVTGWGQDMGVSLIASDPVVRPNLQSGSSVIGSSGAYIKRQSVSFAMPFSQVPRLLLTARGADSSDTFSVTGCDVTASGFTANVVCLNGQSWTQELRVDWIALTRDGLAELRATDAAHGLATIGANATGVKRVAVSFNKTFASAPAVLLTARGETWEDTFAVTATSITTTGFTANVKRTDSIGAGWGQDLKLDWLALI